jgi:hypothetical protein
MRSDIQIYCDCMAQVRTRIKVVQGVLTGQITTGTDDCNAELIFLQLRKTLELIAFASLSANKAAYSAVHEKFASHWNAKKMLGDLEEVNPDYYPVPLDPPQETAPGVKHFPRPADGFMTTDEFTCLYNSCSEILHTRNPFTAKDPTIQIGYSVQEWVARIQRLLGWHLIHLAGGDDKWIVNIPAEGDVQAWPASPTTG